LKTTFEFLGMREEEWMPKCNASFKLSVRFDNWRKPAPGTTRHTYHHPFSKIKEPQIKVFERPHHTRFPGLSLVDLWMQRWVDSDQTATFSHAINPLERVCELHLAPKPLPGSGHEDPDFYYAYHLDADLLAAYLRDLCTGRGVVHKEAEVKQVV